jgi:hypothetical protein
MALAKDLLIDWDLYRFRNVPDAQELLVLDFSGATGTLQPS